MSHEALEILKKALTEDLALKDTMRSLERLIIEAAIARHPLMRDAYRGLGVGRNTFDVKRKRLGVTERRPRKGDQQ